MTEDQKPGQAAVPASTNVWRWAVFLPLLIFIAGLIINAGINDDQQFDALTSRVGGIEVAAATAAGAATTRLAVVEDRIIADRAALDEFRRMTLDRLSRLEQSISALGNQVSALNATIRREVALLTGSDLPL